MDQQIIFQRLNALLASGRMSEMRGALLMLNPVDIAQYLSSLETENLLRVFRILPGDCSADVFSYMDDEQREKLVSSIGDKEAGHLVENMFVDDAVDFLEEMPAELVRRVLSNVNEEQRHIINRFLSYPDGSAGSIMTIEYCRLPLGTTVAEAMDDIRANGVDKETINTLYIVDANGVLRGTLPLRKLITADDETRVDDLMDVNFVSVQTHDDREKAAELVRKYDLLSLPVVDKSERLVGIVTVDDIMDVIQEETTEDIEIMNALTPSEDTYMKTSVWQLAGNRLPWLALMLFGSILTGLIITHYEGLLLSVPALGVALTACIPMLMDSGGNCGQQTSTLVIRALAVGEMQPSDTPRVLLKEFRVSLLVGAVLSVVNYLLQVLVFGRTWLVAFTVSVAILATVVLSKCIGCLLPLGAKALKLDPALTATPLITTIVDTCSLILLFEIASVMLKGVA